MYLHVLGAAQAGASMRENSHQMRLGFTHRKRHGGPLEAALSNVQVHERWTLGYLIDTIYLRDMWMHRVDAARALDRELALTADHDGRIVADVVAEWARRHGRPFTLELHGPAGGTFAHDPDAPDAEHLELDAVEFCRTLGGRTPATGLLATIVPF